jgi:hypothetical protein
MTCVSSIALARRFWLLVLFRRYLASKSLQVIMVLIPITTILLIARSSATVSSRKKTAGDSSLGHMKGTDFLSVHVPSSTLLLTRSLVLAVLLVVVTGARGGAWRHCMRNAAE